MSHSRAIAIAVTAVLSIAVLSTTPAAAAPFPDVAGVLYVRTLDGDTIEVALGPPGSMPEVVRLMKVRFLGVNAPEIHHRCDDTQDQTDARQVASAVKAMVGRFLARAAAEDLPIDLRDVQGLDSFGRILARVHLNGKDMGATLQTAGLVLPADSSNPAAWCAYVHTKRQGG